MTEPVVLVVGSLHHDIMVEADRLPRRDETAVGRRWYPKFGGKGGNQAVAAARAGVRSRMFGAVGQDAFGRYLTDALGRAGVDRRFVAELAGVGSGMSVAIVEAGGDYAATIVSGANLQLDSRALDAPDLWRDVAVLILQNEIPEAVNAAAAAEARRRGVKVILNAAPARDLPAALTAQADLLVVNAVEAGMMGAGPVSDLGSALGAARHLAAIFGSVIVTAGQHGLAAWTSGDGGFDLPAIRVQVASTHGAGDCFVGTLAAMLARGCPLAAACRRATEAASDHVAGRGAAMAGGR